MPGTSNAPVDGRGAAVSLLGGGQRGDTTALGNVHLTRERDPRQAPVAAPTPGLSALRRLLPVALADLRPAAGAAGLSPDQVEAALSVGARRGELRIVADRDGLPLVIAGRAA